MDPAITKVYGNKVRLRACGMCWRDGKLLLVNHSGLTSGDFWAPPGGGVEFGQSLADNLKREFQEETGLDVEIGDFLFACEFLEPPLHSVELFFEVFSREPFIRTGTDPELAIIKDVRFFSPEEIKKLNTSEIHGIFHIGSSKAELGKLHGFYRI
jgi:8-oxo-dGTP diphosphatase